MRPRRNVRVVIMFTLWSAHGVYHYRDTRSQFEERGDGTRYNASLTLCGRRYQFHHWRPLPGPPWHETITQLVDSVHYLPQANAEKLGRPCERCTRIDFRNT